MCVLSLRSLPAISFMYLYEFSGVTRVLPKCSSCVYFLRIFMTCFERAETGVMVLSTTNTNKKDGRIAF